MTPSASRLMRAAVSLFQTVSNQRETDKMLIIKAKIASVSLFQRFGERRLRNSKWDPAANQNSRVAPLKTVKQRNRRRFISKCQYLVCFTPV